MITLNGINLTPMQDKEETLNSVVINGYWITVHKQAGSFAVRTPMEQTTWMDAKHQKVVDAMKALESALGELVQEGT